MIHDDSDFEKTIGIQGSGYNDVGRSFKATAGFNRNDKAPGVGSCHPKDTNRIACASSMSFFLVGGFNPSEKY